MTGDEHRRLLTLAEAAAVTRRNPELLRRWCAAGRIACHRFGRDWLMDEAELARVERMPRRGGTADRPAHIVDPLVLNDALREELASCLEGEEALRAIAIGAEGAALIATDRRVFVARDGVLVRGAARGRPAAWPLDTLRRVQLDLGSASGVLVVTPRNPDDRALTLLLTRGQLSRAAAAADVIRGLIAEAGEPVTQAVGDEQRQLPSRP